MSEIYDVVVAGAGPAGSTVAHLLAQQGGKVLLLDRATFPRVKPCGGGVNARAFVQAPVDLMPVVEQVISRVRFSYRLGSFFDYEYTSEPQAAPRPLVYMTQRDRLDKYLAEQAVEAGAIFRDNARLTSLSLREDSVEAEIEGVAVRARALVGADGANGVTARLLGLQPAINPPVALEANYPYADGLPGLWRDTLALELGSMDGGYGWSFPKADHFNLGCGGYQSEGGRLREHLAALQRHYGLDDLPARNLRGHHLPMRTPGQPITRGRALLVGDAAGLVDPMSGEGIFAAFVSGRLAADSISRLLSGEEATLDSYEAAIERELMSENAAALVLRDAYHLWPWPCYQALRRNELLRRSLCQLITGEKTYSDFLRQLGPLIGVLRLWASLGRLAKTRRQKELAGAAAHR